MKRHLIVTLVVALAASTVQAGATPFTVGKIADEWGTIQTGGVRPASGGNRFWNIQGSASGDFASTGTLRFYMQDVVSQFDAQFGVGNWQVDNIRVAFEHDDAGFSTAGGVNVYHFTNDALAITNGASPGDAAPGEFGGLGVSPLFYQAGANILDTRTAGSTDVSTIFGTVSLVDDFNFSPKGDGDIDVLGDILSPLDVSSITTAGPSYGIGLGAGVGDSTALMQTELATSGSNLDIATLATDIESGTDALSMLLVGDPATIATYKGNPFGGLNPPRIYITATPEPATLAFLGMGGLLALRRRRA